MHERSLQQVTRAIVKGCKPVAVQVREIDEALVAARAFAASRDEDGANPSREELCGLQPLRGMCRESREDRGQDVEPSAMVEARSEAKPAPIVEARSEAKP